VEAASRRFTMDLTPELRSLLVAEADRARVAVAADCAAVSRWDRADGVLRTLVNVGRLFPGEEHFPVDESYPLDTFPATAALLRHGRAYLNPIDVSSAAVAATRGYGSHSGVPVLVGGEIWGELWAGRRIGQRTLSTGDVAHLQRLAARLGEVLAAHEG
jgi:GAF domain-containing protein